MTAKIVRITETRTVTVKVTPKGGATWEEIRQEMEKQKGRILLERPCQSGGEAKTKIHRNSEIAVENLLAECEAFDEPE